MRTWSPTGWVAIVSQENAMATAHDDAGICPR